jgi:hypothetical protein
MTRHDGPGADIEQALQVIARTFGPALIDTATTMRAVRWEWRPVPFGRCIRCLWPANTLGPDGLPWHPLCWWSRDTQPPSYDQWLRRKVERGEWRGGA